MIRRLVGIAALGLGAVLAAGCSAPAATGGASGSGALAGETAVAPLPIERVAQIESPRLAEGVIPPTNRWYSGLVFGANPQPVYPFPIAFATDGEGFTIDLPVVAATERTIAASFGGGLRVDLGAESFEVVRADPVSVTLRFSDARGAIGDVTIAEGWPVVAFSAARDVELSPGAPLDAMGDGVWTTTMDATTFGVDAPEASWVGGALHVPQGASAQWFALPEDGDPIAWADALGDPVTSVTAESVLDSGAVSTRLAYEGTDATIVVPFAGRAAASDCTLGTFETAYGPAPACAAASLEWSVPRVQPRAAYDLAALDAESRAELAALAAEDLIATAPVPADTYFGGKALARLATLLELARSLDDPDLAAHVADRLWAELEPWVDPDRCATEDARCFVYDDTLRLVVGKMPSFGSEEGNDHHFHYGYFLTAGAALAAERPELVARLAPVLDVLAGGAEDGALPPLRVFDPYRGHSWASGLSPFADGNNQESSSEAVAAWNGLALWAGASGDDELAARAEWLLSAEADAARSLWLEPDLDALPPGYRHGIVSLTWGGKRDYATWFSPEPSAILGIQLIPLGPVSLEYLAADPDRVAANVEEAGGEAAFEGPLGDQVLQYSALAGRDALERAVAAVAALPADAIDDGSTRSAMLAWLAAVRLAG